MTAPAGCRVSILIVTHNGWELTRDCLESIYRETDTANIEVIVSDNLSTDGTRERLEKLNLPSCRVILNDRNLGYAGGLNAAARVAKGEILVFLNNDTLVTPGWLEKLLSPLADLEVGLVGPMTDSAGNDQVLGPFAEAPELPPARLELLLAERQGRLREKESLGFFCVALRREVYAQLGPLDESFRVGLFEDDDYCLRARQVGYRLLIAEDAFVYHRRGRAFARLERSAHRRLWEENRRRFERKHGVRWRPPAPPLQARLRQLSSRELARLIEKLEMPTVLVATGVDFWSPWGRPQFLALALARLGCFVFYLTPNRQHDAVNGFEEFDYNLLLVDKLESLREIIFDLVLSAPEVKLPGWLKRKRPAIAIDGGLIEGEDWEELAMQILSRLEDLTGG